VYILLFSLWIVFNAHITFEIVVFGLFFSAVIFWFLCKYMDYSVSTDLSVIKRPLLILKYIYCLIVEIFIANLHSIKFILSRQNKPRPLIVKFRTGLLTDTARVLLANSISLTPGTITISLDGEIFTVHCLDASMADGLENSRLVHILMQIEKGAVQ
jgi:multicomponent Na+:H+ antiporter subunit E